MEEKLERQQLRQNFSPLGWALLFYLLVLNACVALASVIELIFITLRQSAGEGISPEEVTVLVLNNGWGYLATIVIGLVCLWIWQGKEFCCKTLWTRGRPMKVSDFLCLLCLFISGQAAFQILWLLIEAVLNQFGLSAVADFETATMTSDSFSMFLYAGIAAPIAEEILFRGVVLRKLEPYGKRFAIVISALLFGVFHGNLVQTPYAFLVGLVLGYVAVEHNIVWAMVLHMANNLVLADMIGRLSQPVPAVGNALTAILIWGCALASLVILIVRRREVKAYRRENPIAGKPLKCLLTSPGILAVLIVTALTVAADLIGQVIG